MLDRDAARLADCHRRVNVLPLGSGALAGVPYPIDRESVARELGFDGVSASSMDAVSDRDFVVDYLGRRRHLHDALLAAGGGASALVLPGVWLRAPGPRVGHGLQHDASEAQPGLR